MNNFEQLDILELIEEYKKLTTLSKLIQLKIEELECAAYSVGSSLNLQFGVGKDGCEYPYELNCTHDPHSKERKIDELLTKRDDLSEVEKQKRLILFETMKRIEKLNDTYKQSLFVMRFIFAKSYSEISKIMKCSKATVIRKIEKIVQELL